MRFLLGLITIFSFTFCDSVSKEQKAVDAALEEYRSAPSDETAKAFNKSFSDFVKAKGNDHPAIPDYVLEAARLALKRNKLSQSLSWYQNYFGRSPDSLDRANHLLEMQPLIEAHNKPWLSQVYYKSFVNRYSDHPGAQALAAKITEVNLSVDSMLWFMFHQAFDESLQLLNPELAQLYIEMCEISVMTDPGSINGPEHLLRAGDMARAMKLYARAIKDFNWIGKYYPTHSLATSALFLKGRIYYADLKNYPAAELLLQEYLEKDPYGMYEAMASSLLDSIRFYHKGESKPQGYLEKEINEIE